MSHLYRFSDRRNISYLFTGPGFFHRIYSLGATPERAMEIAQMNADVMRIPVTVTFRCAFGKYILGTVTPNGMSADA